jgi:hypothetical protein
MDIIELKRSLQEDRPVKWEQIPDIELYMDQVLNFMEKQHLGLEEDEALTSSMVNNYIKKGLLPRANKKKYKKEHVAHLTAICLFKRVLSVSETDKLLKDQLEGQEIEYFYKKYCKEIDREFCAASDSIHLDMDREELSDMILKLAISSYAQKLACEKLLQFASELDVSPL